MTEAAAVHSALELGVVARVSEAPADPEGVAADCGLTPQGAQALLPALATIAGAEAALPRAGRALVANLCQLFAEEANRRLVRRVADALRRGGRVAIVDILPTERGDGPRPAVRHALGLVLRTGSGRIDPYSTFRRWLGGRGFEDARRHDIPGSFLFTLIAARRR